MNKEEHKAQLDLARIVQAKNQRKTVLFAEVLNTEIFPAERLTEIWRNKAVQALLNSAPLSHKLPLEDFRTVVSVVDGCGKVNEQITLFQFGVLSNSIEAVTPMDLNLSGPEYCGLIDQTVENIKFYGERIAEIRKEVEDRVEEEFSVQAAELAVGSSNGILKSIKGEA